MVTREQALEAVSKAISHMGKGAMVSSAKVALEDVTVLLSKGEWAYAFNRAMDSLAYSVGILHQDYRALNNTITDRSERSGAW